MRSKPCLTLADARTIAAAAETEAKNNKWNVTIAVLDDGGHLLCLQRMDGTPPSTVDIATHKGRSAALARRSTKAMEDRIAAGRVALIKMPGMLPVQGGEPIMVDGECVGAVGVSGVQSHEDAQIALAGIAALR